MGSDNTTLLSVVSSQVVLAVSDLLQAFDYSCDAGVDPWQFAVPCEELRPTGIGTVDLRWLLAKGFVEHQQETTRSGAESRAFRVLPQTSFPKQTCLVLTERGVETFRPLVCLLRTMALLRPAAEYGAQTIPGSLSPLPLPAQVPLNRLQSNSDGRALDLSAARAPGVEPSSAEATSQKRRRRGHPIPTWNAERRELRFKGKIVKQFRVPAGNQEIILSAFDEEGWPDRIHDPLPANGTDHRDRLQATIKSLNRHQAQKLLRFHVTGAGEAICWELS